MQITIDTAQPLSTLDVRLLTVLLGGGDPQASAPTPVVEEEPAPTPAKSKPTPAKSKPAPTPKEEPVSVPEKEEEPEADNPTTSPSPAPETAEYTLEQAIAEAAALVSKGKAAEVKAALAAVGTRRVSELKGSEVSAFMAYLA